MDIHSLMQHQANKYKATYEFKSADATKALPNGVLLLNDTKEYANRYKAKLLNQQ